MSYGVAPKRVAVVDDRPFGRASLAEELKEENFVPEVLDGHYGTIDNLVNSILDSGCNAAVCDYKLNQGSYVMGTGAQAIERLYKKHFPSILITSSVDDHIIDEIRQYRQYIPVLLDKDDYEPPDFSEGIKICELELEGEYQPTRRPWRATVWVNSIYEAGLIGVIVPGWNSDIEIQISQNILPIDLHKFIAPDTHFFAQVNIGAEDKSELYFTNFEVKT